MTEPGIDSEEQSALPEQLPGQEQLPQAECLVAPLLGQEWRLRGHWQASKAVELSRLPSAWVYPTKQSTSMTHTE
jgi:hypothetical protein